MASPREPMLNVPPVVTATIALLGLVHAVRTFVLTPSEDLRFLLLFSFIPARFDPTVVAQGLPTSLAAQLWTFVSYAFIHADAMHLTVNGIWLLAFGSAVARRFGTLRFMAFFLVTAAAGAALHLATHTGEFWPMVGASASISGFMAAAIRFVFQGGGPLGALRAGGAGGYNIPAKPLLATLRDARVLTFLAVWFGLNILFGIGSFSLTDEAQSIAWQAHIGGFLSGLLLFPMFDPIGHSPSFDESDRGSQVTRH